MAGGGGHIEDFAVLTVRGGDGGGIGAIWMEGMGLASVWGSLGSLHCRFLENMGYASENVISADGEIHTPTPSDFNPLGLESRSFFPVPLNSSSFTLHLGR
jgi:hypothetical protein